MLVLPGAFAQAPATGNYQYRTKYADVTYDKNCGYCHPGGIEPDERTYSLGNSDGATFNGSDKVNNLDPQTLFSKIANASWKTSGGTFSGSSKMEKGPGWGTAPTYWGKSEMGFSTVRLASSSLLSVGKLARIEKVQDYGTGTTPAPMALKSAALITIGSSEYDLIPSIEDKKSHHVELIPVDFNVTINTFIPHNYVDHPTSTSAIFAGDNRNSGSPAAATWNEHGSHRTQQKAQLIAVQEVDPNGRHAAYAANADGAGNNDHSVSIGETHKFHKTSSLAGGVISALAWADTTLGDNHLMMDKGTAAKTEVTIQPTTWHSSRKISALFVCNASNPLVNLAPGIGYTVTITADYTTPSTPKYSISGTHDGFPAYEIYINGTRVYQHDPMATGDGPGSLFPPEEYTISIPLTPLP